MSRDTSTVYDSRDLDPEFAAAFPKGLPWVFETDEDQNYFATEDEACAAQRDHRRRNGFHPITGASA